MRSKRSADPKVWLVMGLGITGRDIWPSYIITFFFISFNAESVVGHCRLSSMGPQSLQIEELNDCEVAAIISQHPRVEIGDDFFGNPVSPNQNLRCTFAR